MWSAFFSKCYFQKTKAEQTDYELIFFSSQLGHLDFTQVMGRDGDPDSGCEWHNLPLSLISVIFRVLSVHVKPR